MAEQPADEEAAPLMPLRVAHRSPTSSGRTMGPSDAPEPMRRLKTLVQVRPVLFRVALTGQSYVKDAKAALGVELPDRPGAAPWRPESGIRGADGGDSPNGTETFSSTCRWRWRSWSAAFLRRSWNSALPRRW